MGERRWGRGTRALAFAVPAVAALAAVLLVATPAPGLSTADDLPDLVSDSPDGWYLSTYDNGASKRLLVRFNGYVHNAGTGALEITGANPTTDPGDASPEMTSVSQRIYSTGGGYRDDSSGNPTVIFETADYHNHWHLRAAMHYGLYDLGGTSLVAPAMKVGFCLADSEAVGSAQSRAYPVSPADPFCQQGNPGVASVTMGISPGWRDRYGSGLTFQWVDASGVLPGRYRLGAESDPDQHLIESDETNNGVAFAPAEIVIPGHLAKPVTLAPSDAGSTAVPLTSEAFGAPGEVRYRIESAPTRGTLSAAVGSVLAPGDALTYTPSASYAGLDTFSYSAFDATNTLFPTQPAVATVTVRSSVGAPTVSVSGAPATLVVATSVQLTATVVADPPTVTWSVNGVPGGSATTGTITPGGLYTAPAAVPAPSTVQIRATSANAFGQVSVQIVPTPPIVPAPSPTPPAPPPPAPPAPPPPSPSPSPPASPSPAPPAAPTTVTPVGAPKPTKPTNALRSISLARFGNDLLVTAASDRAGTVRVVARKAGRTIGSCTIATPSGRQLTCAIEVRRTLVTKGVAVSLTLRANGRLAAIRRVAFVKFYGMTRDGMHYWTKPPASVSLSRHPHG
jgi:hypothetical protein